MICRRCIQQRRSFRELVSIANLRLAATDGAAASSQHRVSGRGFTRSALHDAEAVSSSTDILKPQSSPGPPAANSTSAAQPFSTLRTPSPKAQGVSSSVRSEPRTPSSLPAGAQMKGVGYIKAQGDPIAKEDSEYPAWLWTCLDKQSGEDGGSNGAEDGDQFSKSRKQRRLAAKRLKKQELLNPASLEPKIPLHEQSIDLPMNQEGTVEGAILADQSRAEITKEMRKARRKSIKESNYLKGMR